MTATLKKPIKSARKAKGDGHLRRAEILHAAEGIFVRDGYEGATIRKIADEVGVSSTALYMHFRDKDEILIEICERAISTLLANNTEISKRPIDVVSRLRLMMDAYMNFGLQNPNAYRLVFCVSRTNDAPGRAKVSADLAASTYDRFKCAVSDIAAEGRLRHGDVGSAAQILWSACHGLVALRITRLDIDWAPAEVMVSVMLDSLFQGMVTD